MKLIIFSLALCFLSLKAVAQQGDSMSSDRSYQDIINIDEINGMNVFASDTFNRLIQRIIAQKHILVSEEQRYSKIYFVNNSNEKFLKIWSSPDLGYGWFFSIGYTKQKKCLDCGSFIGKDANIDYVVNNDIKLGDDIKQVWNKAHLNYFRKFSFQQITYYYFEKGIKQEVPFSPNHLFYYKFNARGKLIEIGFGYGMVGENPMLSSQ